MLEGFDESFDGLFESVAAGVPCVPEKIQERDAEDECGLLGMFEDSAADLRIGCEPANPSRFVSACPPWRPSGRETPEMLRDSGPAVLNGGG